MKEYAALSENLVKNREVFKKWLRKSYAYAGSIPAKAKKARGGKKG